MHLIIITLTALLGIGLAGHGFLWNHGGSSSASAPHARAAMDVQPGSGPS